jgi:type II secretory pathway component PulF
MPGTESFLLEAVMLFSSCLPLSTLIELCRVTRHYLASGLSLVDVFRQQSRSGPTALRPVAGRIADSLAEGESFPDALGREAASFPPLLLALADVGAETGMLPEVFGELERYFQRQQSLRRQFLSAISWPVFQFIVAVLVITGLIFVLGLLPTPDLPGHQRYDPLGLGLQGPTGAVIFLSVVVGILGGAAVAYTVVVRSMKQKALADRMLLRLPAVGPCVQALALYRFCLALRLTTETGMSIGKAVNLSLRATSNEAFIAQNEVAQTHLRKGEPLTLALQSTDLFPEDFLHIFQTGEESGRLADVLHQQSEYQHELALRRMGVLTTVAGGVVWVMIGGVIIFFIFRLFGSYLSLLDSVAK